MSNKIDQRIVEMSFENKKFEKGIAESGTSLKEFSKALKDTGTGKNFDGLEKSVGHLSSSFSALEQIGIGALRRIGEAAVDAGAKLLKNLTIDQLASGWTKYEQKLASVQTIMNATGKSIDEVNGYLDQLMWFSDETSYGFTDMTAALAQMTSSGGDVEKLIPLITGVANATAFAGKGAAEFSRAMYNLNQSYGSGNLQYIDWKSLELAGIAGKQLKQIFIETGIELGALNEKGQTVKGTIVDIGNFGTTLQEKWADTRVMEAAFGKFSELSQAAYKLVDEGVYDTASEAMDALAGQYSKIAEESFRAAQTAKTFGEAISATKDAVSSGWMRTYEIIFGELDEAKKNFSALTETLYTIFAASGEVRNEMLAWIKEEGGISNMFQGLQKAAVALLSILHPISQAFDQIFPPRTKEQWLEMTKIFSDFTQKLIIGEKTADNIRRTFAGLFAVIDIGWQLVKFFVNALFTAAKVLVPFVGGIGEATAGLGDFLVEINKAIKSSGFFQYALLGVEIAALLIRNAILSVVGMIVNFVQALWETDDPLKVLGDIATEVFGGIVDSIKMVVDWLSDRLPKPLVAVIEWFKKLGSNIATFAKNGFKSFTDLFKGFDLSSVTSAFKSFGNVIVNLDFSQITKFVVAGVLLIFITQIGKFISASTGLVKALKNVVNGFSGLFEKAKPNLLQDLAIVIGVLAASIWVLSTIPAYKVKSALQTLGLALLEFLGVYVALQAINIGGGFLTKKLGLENIKAQALNLIGVAAALGILVVALKSISKIDESTVWKSVKVLTAIGGLLAAYEVLTTLLSLIPSKGIINISFTNFALGILLLIGAVKLLSGISTSEIALGVLKLTGIVAVIGAAEIVFGLAAKIGKGNKVSQNILSLSAGILAMLGVMKILSAMKTDTITKGLGNLALISLVLAGLEVLFGLAGRIGGSKFKMNILSITLGMVALLGIIAIVSEMNKAGMEIEKGIGVITELGKIIIAIELLTAVAARISGKNKTQQILLSVALTMGAFTAIIAVLRTFSVEEIQQGLLTISEMVGLIGAIELITALASKLSGKTKIFGTLIGTVAALLALTASLALLSAVPQEELRQASTSLAIAAVAIAGLAVSIGVIVKALSSVQPAAMKISSLKSLIPAFAALVVIIGAAFGLFLILQKVSETFAAMDWNVIGQFAVGLGIVVAIMGVMALLGSAFKAMGGASFVSVVTGMAAALIGFVGVLLGVAALLTVFALLASGFDHFIEDRKKFQNGINLMVDTAAGIGRIIGAFVGGIAFETLIGIGQGIAGFAEAVSTIETGSFDGLSELASAILIISAAAVLDGLARWLSFGQSSIEVFGVQLAGLIVALKVISLDDVDKTTAVLAALSPMANNLTTIANASRDIPNSGGFLWLMVGDNNIDQFGQKLNRLIYWLTSEGITPVTASKTTMVIAALVPMANHVTTIANATKDIPNSGGFLWLMVGDNNIDDFGYKLSQLIYWLTSEGITPATAAKTTMVLAALAPMADNLMTIANATKDIPNSGGFLWLMVGDNNIDDFGLKLSKLIYWLTSEGVTPVTAAKTTMVLAALAPMAVNLIALAEASEYIPNSGGLAWLIVGDNNIDDFAKNLAAVIPLFGAIDTALLGKAVLNLQAMSIGMLPALKDFITLANDFTDLTSSRSGFGKNKPLTEFAKDFVDFVELLVDVDFSNVGPALTALAEIKESFAVVGADVMANATESFENNKEPFINAIIAILEEADTAVTNNKQPIIDNIEGIAKSLPSKSDTYVKKFKTLGKDLIKGLKAGIDSQKASALTSISVVANSIVEKAKNIFDSNSPSKVFMAIGSWCTKGLALGITSETTAATDAATNMALDTEEAVRDALGVHSLSDIWKKIGEWLPKSLGEGITSVKSWLLNLAKDLGIDTSKYTLDGITETLSGTASSSMTEAIEDLLEQFKTSLEEAVPDITDEIEDTSSAVADAVANNGVGTDIGATIGDNITDGLADSLKDPDNVEKAEEAVESLLDKLQATLDEKKFYGQLSLEEELEAYKAIRAEYAEGSEERKKIDREIYTLEKEIYEAQKRYIEEIAAAQKKAAEERLALEKEYAAAVAQVNADLQAKLADYQKTYNDTVADAYADAQEKRQAADEEYANAYNDILKSAEDERIRAREEYASKQKEINQKLLSDIDAQNKAYEDAVKSRADAIYGSYGLFDEVAPDEEVTGEELLQNLRDQGAAFSEWQQSLEALRARGVSEALIEELQAMGPSSKAQIKALLTLTDAQLDEYVSLFQGKYAFARTQAEAELVGLRESTNENIRQLISDAGTELADLETTFQTTMSNIDQQCSSDLNDLAQTYSQKLAEINSDLESKLAQAQQTLAENTQQANDEAAAKLEELKTNFDKEITEINDNLEESLKTIKENFADTMKTVKEKSTEELEELNKVFKKKIEDINNGIDVQLDTLEENFDTTLGNVVTNTSQQMDDLVSKVESAATGFYSAGLNAAQSFANGLRDGTWYAQLAAQALANAAIAAANQTLAIGSPSKIFRMMGQFVSAGFAKGITDYSSKAEDSTETMAQNIINAMGNALSMLESTDSEFSPVITPVIDLSVAKRQIQTANDLLGSSNSYQIAQQSAKLAASTKDRQNGSSDTSTVINNNFNLTGMQVRSDADIDDIAQKLYNKQQSAMRGRGLKAFAH